MPFNIRLGVPEMADYWRNLSSRAAKGSLAGEEAQFFKKAGKVLKLLSQNPRHNGLQSHEIPDLSRKCGCKVFQSYLENNTPGAGRIYWAYGPNPGEITVLSIVSRPEDKKRGAYLRIKLSSFPPK